MAVSTGVVAISTFIVTIILLFNHSDYGTWIGLGGVLTFGLLTAAVLGIFKKVISAKCPNCSSKPKQIDKENESIKYKCPQCGKIIDLKTVWSRPPSHWA